MTPCERAARPVDVRSLSAVELKEFIVGAGFPAYRAKQVYQWLHHHHVTSFDAMANVPKAVRQVLAQAFVLAVPQVADRRESADGTVKYVLDYGDALAETVAIPTDDRLTVCFSTQAGCAMGCAFCATGRGGFTRNLSAVEMVDELTVVARDFSFREIDSEEEPGCRLSQEGQRITNVVAMGQGEPFLNYDALLAALRIMNDPEGFAIGARKLTVSTSGILDGIRRFADEPEQFGLAVSLHSAVQSVRDKLMPALANQPLPALKQALLDYQAATNRRITFEYLMIEAVNDDPAALAALIDFCSGGLFHVNLLPFHPIEGTIFKPSPLKTIRAWEKALNDHGINGSIRSSRGLDIDGACGQLANRMKADH